MRSARNRTGSRRTAAGHRHKRLRRGMAVGRGSSWTTTGLSKQEHQGRPRSTRIPVDPCSEFLYEGFKLVPAPRVGGTQASGGTSSSESHRVPQRLLAAKPVHCCHRVPMMTTVCRLSERSPGVFVTMTRGGFVWTGCQLCPQPGSPAGAVFIVTVLVGIFRKVT